MKVRVSREAVLCPINWIVGISQIAARLGRIKPPSIVGVSQNAVRLGRIKPPSIVGHNNGFKILISVSEHRHIWASDIEQ